MADNTVLNAGVGGDTVATDDIGGVKHQRVKIEIGADGAAADVHSGNPLPVIGPLTDAQLRAAAVPVSGTLTDAQLRATAVPVSGTVTASGPLTDTQLRATPVPVSGTVTASGPLTDTQLRATAVPVSGPLTDTQLRATAVPVSGTVTATGPLTDTQLRAMAVPVSASGTMTADQGSAAAASAAWPMKLATPAGDSAMDDVNDAVRVNVIAGAGSGGTAMTDDQPFAPGTTSVTPVAGTYRVTRDAVDDGDAGAFAMTSRRAVLSALETPAGDSAMDDALDAVRVNIVAGAGSGGTAMNDDSAFTVGASQVTPAGGFCLAARDAVNDGDTGALAMTPKRALLSALETPNGDSAMDDTNDAVRVNIIAGAGSGGTAMVDDQPFTPATTSITPIGGIFRTSRDLIDDGDAGAVAMTASRAIYVSPETPNGDSMVDEANDALRVNIIAGAGSGGTAMTDDSAFTVGSTSVTPAAATFRVTRDSVDDGDAGALAMTQKRALIVCPESPAGDSLVDDVNDGIKIVGATGTLAQDTTLTGGTAKAILRGAAKGGTPAADATVEAYNADLNVLSVRDVDLRNCIDGVGSAIDVMLGSGSTVAVSGITTSVTPGTAMSHLGKRTDDVAGATDVGVATLMVRKDTLATLGPIDGDYARPRLTDRGAQWMKHDGVVTINALTSSDVVTVTGGAGQTADVKITLDAEPVVLGNSSSTIGKLDANSGVIIGDVNVIPGTGAANLGKAAGNAAGATDTGIAPLAVRDDSLDTLSDPEGDYVPLRVSSQGALHVTGGGGGTEYTVDVAAPANPTGGTVLAERTDTLATLTEANGDWTNLRASSKGALWTKIESSALDRVSVEIGLGKNTELDQYTPGAGNPGIPVHAVRKDTPASMVDVNLDYAPLQVTSLGGLRVALAEVETGSAVAVSGSVNATLQAGGAAIGTVAVTNIIPGTTATALGKSEDATHATGDVGVMSLVVRNDTRGTLVSSNTDYSALQVNASGDLRVDGSAVTQPISAASLPLPSGAATQATLASVDTKTPALGQTTMAGSRPVVIASNQSAVPISAVSLPLPTGAASETTLNALNGKVTACNTGAVTVSAALPTGSNTVGNVGCVAITTGGATPYKLISAATTNATNLKASAGKLYGYYLSNVNAAARYVKFYNKASAPTVGTDTPVLTLMIPAGGAANLATETGIAFSTGIAFATTTGVADSDTAAVAANEIVVNLMYL